VAFDDFHPLDVMVPDSSKRVGDLVLDASARGQAVYPCGGGTMIDFGLPPTKPGIGIDLQELRQVIDYPARDMTITVQTGITIARLQEALAKENQHLPVDVPQADRATLGGVLATNTSGLRRYGFGTLRDYVIGISVINDRGLEVKAGGRVVKNVAGYDLCKLYVGSLGTLGIITQVTLKLKPRPEENALVALACELEMVGPFLEQLHRSRTRPVCLDLLNHTAVAYINQQLGKPLALAPWIIVVGFEENRRAVEWQVQQLVKELPAGCRGLDAFVGSSAGPLWQALTEFPAWPEPALTFKANLLPHATASFCQQVAELPETVAIQAHGNGIVIGQVLSKWTLERALAVLNTLLDVATTAQGNLVLLRCPTAWKTRLPVWGRPRGDVWLMRAVKEKLDPRGLFNPGRFVDGI
jgi:glycolate oxidase FAD binding subunit